MQHRAYPLPPLLLGEVIDQCIIDHEHTHGRWCIQARRCNELEARSWNMIPAVIDVQEGDGWHVCDETCIDRCLRSYCDSDWVVEVQYHTAGYCALYGVLWVGDTQDVRLWMDPKLDITPEPDAAA
jgi:hypothetical protein